MGNFFLNEFYNKNHLFEDKTKRNRTGTECEEEEFNLLTVWEQLNEVKLERNHMDTVLRGQDIT